MKSRATWYPLGLQLERVSFFACEFNNFANRATDRQKILRDLDPTRPIDVFYTTTTEIEEIHRNLLSDRWSMLSKQWISGIQRLHSFDSTRAWRIVRRETSLSRNSEELQITR